MFLDNCYIFSSYEGSIFTFVELILNQYHDGTKE